MAASAAIGHQEGHQEQFGYGEPLVESWAWDITLSLVNDNICYTTVILINIEMFNIRFFLPCISPPPTFLAETDICWPHLLWKGRRLIVEQMSSLQKTQGSKS